MAPPAGEAVGEDGLAQEARPAEEADRAAAARAVSGPGPNLVSGAAPLVFRPTCYELARPWSTLKVTAADPSREHRTPDWLGLIFVPTLRRPNLQLSETEDHTHCRTSEITHLLNFESEEAEDSAEVSELLGSNKCPKDLEMAMPKRQDD
ncbi:hypothetical protein E5288_WYG013501 [Bos mutus]|uniref:Uncharacterized protein n=1 Tax=Bos mutus TaxID=72004 RepID=A0A6B0SBJ7_9CETA|nr:hypothetical protein [Bos mutus]